MPVVASAPLPVYFRLLLTERNGDVSTATTEGNSALCLCGPWYLLIRRLQSLTGLMFGGYLLVHLVVNATIAQGGSHYQQQVDKIHSLPFLQAIEWGAIFLPLLFHAIYGIWITVNGRPNVGNYPYTRNNLYLLQRISAIIILLFVLFHVLSLKYQMFGPELAFVPEGGAMSSIARHMHASWLLPAVIYPIGVLAAACHTANGLWAAAITWGLTISAASQRRFGWICVGLFVAMTIVGMVSVIAAANLNPSAQSVVAFSAAK